MNDFGGSLALSDGRWCFCEEMALVSPHVAPIGPSPGGDRADAFVCLAGALHLRVLDACGHGAGAARVATFAQNALRVLICGGDGPGAALATLDRLLTHLEIESCRFVTAFVASLDASNRVSRYGSAGHLTGIAA